VTAAAADADVMANPSAAALLRCCLSLSSTGFKIKKAAASVYIVCNLLSAYKLHINVNKRRKKKPKEIEYSRCVNEKE
jgi:hypothetical protein